MCSLVASALAEMEIAKHQRKTQIEIKQIEYEQWLLENGFKKVDDQLIRVKRR